MPSEMKVEVLYTVNMFLGSCTCQQGYTDGSCKHQSAVITALYQCSLNFLTVHNTSVSQLMFVIATGTQCLLAGKRTATWANLQSRCMYRSMGIVTLWMNEGHLTAFAHMYQMTVFVYRCALNRWLAYGDNAHSNSGYVCLLSTGSHFDVLHGVDSVIS